MSPSCPCTCPTAKFWSWSQKFLYIAGLVSDDGDLFRVPVSKLRKSREHLPDSTAANKRGPPAPSSSATQPVLLFHHQ